VSSAIGEEADVRAQFTLMIGRPPCEDSVVVNGRTRTATRTLLLFLFRLSLVDMVVVLDCGVSRERELG